MTRDTAVHIIALDAVIYSMRNELKKPNIRDIDKILFDMEVLKKLKIKMYELDKNR